MYTYICKRSIYMFLLPVVAEQTYYPCARSFRGKIRVDGCNHFNHLVCIYWFNQISYVPQYFIQWSSDRGSGRRPSKNMEARERRVCLVKCFPAILGCSDFVYGEISGIPTELIPRPMSKFLLEKKLRALEKCPFYV